ncbi:cation:proton antiporter [Candidatus Woesearchaeota archaeon]|nr:cation:proton antiporter [Candidatus Woesearchaeota archaeon]
MAQILLEVGIIFLVAGLFALLSKVLKQPLIIGYLIAGLLIGPSGFGLIKGEEVISSLSELGVAFLLFIVGMQLDFRKLKSLGKIVLTAGSAQIILTFAITYLVLLQFSFLANSAIYLAFALTLSSTIVVAKLLEEKGGFSSLHGRIILGILLTQDIVALCALTLLSAGEFSLNTVFFAILKLAILIFAAVFFNTTFLPQAFKFFAKSRELLFVTSIMWFFTVMLGTNLLGLSQSIGAFLAGISLASISYNLEIESKAVALRDFFSTIFFVTVGMQITLANFNFWFIPIILVSLFVLIGNPIIVFFSTILFGFTARTALLSGLALGQVSEFSLVFISLAHQLNLVPKEVLSFTALVALLTFIGSTYSILYDRKICNLLKPALDKVNKWIKKKEKTSYVPKKYSPEIIICGYGRVGKKIGLTLKKKKILVIDFNPEIINKVKKKKPAIYGDIGDEEILNRLPLSKTEMVVSTIGDLNDTKKIINHVKAYNKKIKVIVTASEASDALLLYDQGADYVLVPHLIGGEYAALLINKGNVGAKKLKRKKEIHIKKLRKL